MSRSSVRRTDETIDRCVAAYNEESNRWDYRRIYAPPGQRDRFMLTHRAADGCYSEIKLTYRECKDSDDAQAWVRTYQSRAAMRAALAILK